jgi:predicted Zn-dependent protease
MSPNSQLELAAQVLALVRAGGGDPEAEVTVERQALALTRFANSFIHQNLADDTTTVHLRLHAGGRTATGASTVTDPDGLRDLVARTGEAVGHAPPDPGWPGLAPPAPLAGAGGFDEPTAAAEPAQRAQRVRAFVDAAGGLETAGYCRTVHWSTAFANSAGQAVTGQTSEATMDGIARVGAVKRSQRRRELRSSSSSDGVARRTSVSLSDLDGALLGGRAAAKARAGVDPVELPPGRYEVVLEPTAVADLLANLAIWGFNGKALAEQRTFAEPGVAQFDPSITLVDDPFAGRSPGRSFDGEGTPKRRLVLVDAGVTETVVHDRRTAALVGGGAATTGHALPGGGSSWGALPLNLGLSPGPGQGAAGRGEATAGGGLSPAPTEPVAVGPGAAGLVGQVERGLLVTDLWYTRVLDPKTLVMTGLTRNGVWLIEDGKVAAPVQNLRFTQSYPQALAPGAVKGVGPSASLLLTGLTSAWLRAPALHLAAWNFTGGSSG